MKQRLGGLGIEPAGTSPAEAGDIIRKSGAVFIEAVKAAGLEKKK